MELGERAQWLRVYTVLVEGLNSITPTGGSSKPPGTPASEDDTLFWMPWAHMCVYTNTDTYIHITKLFFFKKAL